MFSTFLASLAVTMLCLGYLAQIIKIHRHREVRDLSLPAFLGFGIAYVILGYEGYLIDSHIFLIKNIIAFFLVLTIVGQIWHHQDDEWHDEADVYCNCGNELEDIWKYCPDCGIKTEESIND